MKRISFILIACLLLSTVPASAEIGPLTKRERLKKQALAGDYEAIHENFLNQNYEIVDKLAGIYLKKSTHPPYHEDVLYLQALSLLKLSRGDDAREKLRILEAIYESKDQKAAAAASIADSHYFEKDSPKAYDSYRDVLSKYDGSSQTPYVLYRLFELSGSLGKRAEAERYKARIFSEYPQSQEARDITERFSLPVSGPAGGEDIFYTVQVGSFSDKKNARGLVNKLNFYGYEAHMETDEKNRMYRVRVGKAATKSQAEELEVRLKKEGYPTKIYP